MHEPVRSSLGGIGLLLANEARTAPLGGNVALGAALALGGMLSASLANVIQAGPAGRDVPLVSLLAWAILYGVGIDVAVERRGDRWSARVRP